ncbi:copper oxidase [Geothermobacter hydrogeniphilus]|uniref:Copper oxidase n=2 Tax=Geothermobacter hydrogeniphilus TaxID=1969733 RepID=A0A2K2HF01_9BACT|nr:copper oxidase [Geothermobacter hydrogeniphilus]
MMTMSLLIFGATTGHTAPVPGGTLDPTTIPKYVQPLVIPPVMPPSSVQPTDPTTGQPTSVNARYNISVRQFRQQILPGGIWNTVNDRNDQFGATTLWSYGPDEDKPAPGYVAPAPLGTPGATFNYPAFTVENNSNAPTTVRWINGLVDEQGNYLPHLFKVDQTLHWANPTNAGCANAAKIPQTDCRTSNPAPYTGPVPIVTHVHGAHVNAESDGYPEAWWLPAANNIPVGYASRGTIYTQNDITTAGNISTVMTPNEFNPIPGSAFYSYENTQPATTLWYHDHSLGMTRLNVYAGPAGFWLIRGGAYDSAKARRGPAVLPGPAPVLGAGDPNFDPAYRKTIREIPIVIQDRSFNADGSLFYPESRQFFDGFAGPYVGDPQGQGSDIAPIWNPEAFFNTMVVNGTTWPEMSTAPAKYRFRLLNGCNSRFINLAMFVANPDGTLGAEIPFYQIGGDQGFLPRVVQVKTGFATALKGKGKLPGRLTPLPDPSQALLMAPAERADVIVDFSGLPDGTVVRMINTAPDAPFGGFPDIPADPGTTGQVMQFRVNSANLVAADALTTSPLALRLKAEPKNRAKVVRKRRLTLNEEESAQVCVRILPDGTPVTVQTFPTPNPNIAADCAAINAVPQAPKAALLGGIGKNRLLPGKPYVGIPMLWSDPITENPQVGDTELWDFYNLTVDGHPIHMHLVRFQVKGRQLFNQAHPRFRKIGRKMKPLPTERGYKDTVLAYPGEITQVKATFDLPGLYVWHCHIVEHEDNEMMRPYYVGAKPVGFPVP